MKICVYGAGAGGGHFAVKLALAGHDVSVIARGEHLAAIKKSGLTLKAGSKTLHAKITAAEIPAELVKQDVVLVGVKATGLKAIASQLAPLVSPETCVVFPQNGMPWWYPIELPGHLPRPPSLPTFDLAPEMLKLLRPEQILSGVIYSANEIEAPGVVKNNSPSFNCIDIGTIYAKPSPQLTALRGQLNNASLQSRDVPDSRAAFWSKLIVNISASMIGLVTECPSSVSRSSRGLEKIFLRAANEALDIAGASGFDLRPTIDPARILARMTDHKASILQDYEQRRPMEIAEIILAPLCFARAYAVETPTLDTLAAIAVNMARSRELFPDHDRWDKVWP